MPNFVLPSGHSLLSAALMDQLATDFPAVYRMIEYFGGRSVGPGETPTNNLSALEAASAWCEDSGGMVLFGGGLYGVDGTVMLKSMTTFQGANPRSSTILQLSPEVPTLDTPDGSTAGTSVAFISLMNLGIDGGWTADWDQDHDTLATGAGIRLRGAAGGPDDPAALLWADSSSIPDPHHRIVNCRVRRVNGHGIHLTGRGEMHVEMNSIGTCARNGILCEAPDNWFSGNSISTLGDSGMKLTAGNQRLQNEKYWFCGKRTDKEGIGAGLEINGAGNTNIVGTNVTTQDTWGPGYHLDGIGNYIQGQIDEAGGGRLEQQAGGMGTRAKVRTAIRLSSCDNSTIVATISGGNRNGTSNRPYLVDFDGSGSEGNSVELYGTPHVSSNGPIRKASGYTNSKRYSQVVMNGAMIEGEMTLEQLLDPTNDVNDRPEFFSRVGLVGGGYAERNGAGGWRVFNPGTEVTPDSVAAVLSLANCEPRTATIAAWSVSVDKAGGSLAVVLTKSSTAPTNTQVFAGTDELGSAADFFETATNYNAGLMTGNASGLEAGESYYAYFAAISASGIRSDVVSSGVFTMPASSTSLRASFPSPEPLVGYGKNVTGGRNYPVFIVTSGASGTASGTMRWAMAQAAAAGGGYIIPVVNAFCDADDATNASTGRLVFGTPNITLDGRYAEFVFTGGRLEPEASNQMWDNVIHQGFIPGFTDGRDAGSAADNVRIGPWLDSTAGTALTDGQYWRRCMFLGSEDEAFSINMRGYDQATGNTAQNITVEKCMIYPALAGEHQMAVYISDGTKRMTMFQNFCPSYGRARWPFVRKEVEEIEFINNFSYDFWQRPVETVGNELHVINNYFANGPHTSSTGQAIYAKAGSVTYHTGNITEKPPLTGGSGSFSETPLFSGNEADLPVIPASLVPSVVPAAAGPRRYGGAIHPIVDKYVQEAADGTIPAEIRTYTTADRVTLHGGTYPAHNGAYVPLAYLDIFPEDTDLAAIIADGSAWAGYKVAERVGRFLQWDGASSPYVRGSIQYVADSGDTNMDVTAAAGQVVVFAVNSRSWDSDPGIFPAGSTYNAANLVEFPVTASTDPTSATKHRVYCYTSDGNPASFQTNNAGGEMKGISGIILEGVDVPSAFLGSTNTLNTSGANISIPGGTVAVGDVVVACVTSGIDQTTPAFVTAAGAGLDDVQVVNGSQSDLNAGLGIYWIVGIANATSVGPVTATANVADTWQGATLAFTPSA